MSLGDEDERLQDFGRQAGAALRESERIDAVTSARLSAARARAVASAGSTRRAGPLAFGGAVAASLLAVLLVGTPQPQSTLPAATDYAARDTLELLTDDQDPQFYQDLDLYLWLEAEDAHA